MSEPGETFRINLISLLEKTGWSQAALARKMRLAPTAINRWITGEVKPGLDAIEAIASVFGVTASELISPRTPEPRVMQPDPQRMLEMLQEYIIKLEIRTEMSENGQKRLKQEIQKLQGPEGVMRDIQQALPRLSPSDLEDVRNLIKTMLEEQGEEPSPQSEHGPKKR